MAFFFPSSGWRALDRATVQLPVTAPAVDNTTISGVYTFAADTAGLPKVAAVEFKLGSLRLGVVQAAPYELRWNTGYGKDGNYSLRATAMDAFGRIVATGERIFNIENQGTTMYVGSPDLTGDLSGTVTFHVHVHDPTNYPANFHLFIDGEESSYWDIGSAPAAHATTAIFKIDTTRFSNGEHELVIAANASREINSPHSYTNYSAMLSRNVTFTNSHALMEITTNYQSVYLQPGQTNFLSCRQLFTDDVWEPCEGPAYRSENPQVAHVSEDGVVTATGNGFTTIQVQDGSRTAQVYVSVRTDFNIPHFAGTGRILNSYEPGNSFFPVAPFVLDPGYIQSAGLLAEIKRASFNTVSFGFYLNPRSETTSFEEWKLSQDRLITSRIQWARNNGFHVIATGDDGFRRPGDDAWWTLNWPYGRQATQYAMQTLADSGIAIATEVVDEAAMLWGRYPVNPSKVGEEGLPGQPGSFQNIVCSGGACTVNWPGHGYQSGRWIAFHGSLHPELNSRPGQPFIVQRATQNTFDFVPNAPIEGTFSSGNDPNLEILLFAGWPCKRAGKDAISLPCAPFPPNDAVRTYSTWLRSTRSRVPFSWPALGALPPAIHGNWVGQSAVEQNISDYASHYWDVLSGSRTYAWSSGVQQRTFWMKNAFYSRQPYMAQDRPQLVIVCGSSFAYTKQSSGSYYNPLADTLDQPGCDGSVASAEMMTAVALGAAGVRQYQFDLRTPNERANLPKGAYVETGMRPDATESNSREIWQASGYASNLITKVLRPYILGSAEPSPGYQRGITTAVRRGNDAIMLMIINGNDAERTVKVDFTPYRANSAPAVRYALSYVSLQTDLIAGTGDKVTLPKGASVVYLFPFQSSGEYLQPVPLKAGLPAGASQAAVVYNYIYGEHLSQRTDQVNCTGGCILQLDRRLGDVYYQFLYTDANGLVLGRSSITKLDLPEA